MSEQISKLQAEVEQLRAENEKLRASNRRWMRIAGTDDLTGLPNKVCFSTVFLPPIIAQANETGKSFICIIIAPDKLGDINMRFGRVGGDEIVKGVATFLKETLEEGEKIVHVDGANFIILMPDAGDDSGKRRTRQLRARSVSRRFSCGEDAVGLTLSIGTVLVDPEPASGQLEVKAVGESILQRLSAALDLAKQQGGDQIVEDDKPIS
jgi:two-component system cell cycle response regulator